MSTNNVRKSIDKNAQQKTRVVRIRRKNGIIIQDCDIYIGRKNTQGGWNLKDSIWKNKYTIKQCGSAEKAVEFYKKDLLKNKSLMALIPTLKGKTLGCWCKDEKKPTACHGDVLVELAETYENISK